MLYLGIPPSLSARIEREEKEAITASAVTATRPNNPLEKRGLIDLSHRD